MSSSAEQLKEEYIAPEIEADLLREEKDMWKDNYELLQERLVELELAVEDEGWRRLGMEGERDFSRNGLRTIVGLSRIMFLKNPLMKRGVEMHAFYVWGRGLTIKVNDEIANAVVHRFMDNRMNRREFTAHAARVKKEIKLKTEGNVFFVLFTNQLTGKVDIRSLPFDEVSDTVTNPQDKRDVWFIKREWTEESMNFAGNGATRTKTRKALYPIMGFNPKGIRGLARKPDKVGEYEIFWNSPVYHVDVGGLDDMKFGVPETYAAMDWARAYKNFLEDWASLVRAISRFAWKASAKKGKSGIVRDKLSTENGNRPPVAGSTAVVEPGVDLTPINKSGATTSAADGKFLRLMVASALHLPDTILSNDPQQGALATAKTLDRPTELVVTDRQTLWSDVLKDILQYVLLQAAKATNSASNFPGAVVRTDEDGNEYVEMSGSEEEDPLTINITFPPINDEDPVARINAVIQAFTQGGKELKDVAPKTVFRRLVLSVLGVDNVDEIIEEMESLDEEDETQPQPEPVMPVEAVEALVEALREVRDDLVSAND